MQWNQSIPEELADEFKAWADSIGLSYGKATEAALTLLKMLPVVMRARILSGTPEDIRILKSQLSVCEIADPPEFVEALAAEIRARVAQEYTKRPSGGKNRATGSA